jgi:hypothetical protein
MEPFLLLISVVAVALNIFVLIAVWELVLN